MSIAELSYMYDVLKGIYSIIALLFSLYLAYVLFVSVQYFLDEKTNKQKQKMIKHIKIVSIIFIILIFLPSPRTIILSKVENQIQKQEVKEFVLKLFKEKK